jgi:hypothetical protein
MNVLEKTVLKTRFGMLGGFSLLLLTFAASGCSRRQVQAASAMPAPLVTLANATAHDVPRYLDEIGRNGAFESVTVTPQVGGRITERHFQDGENLKKGQILFVTMPEQQPATSPAATPSAASLGDEKWWEVSKTKNCKGLFGRHSRIIMTCASRPPEYFRPRLKSELRVPINYPL